MGDFYSACCTLCRASPFLSSRESCAILVHCIQSFLSPCNFVHPKCLGSFCNFSVIQPVLPIDKGIKSQCLGLLFDNINLYLLIGWFCFKFPSALLFQFFIFIAISLVRQHQHSSLSDGGCDRGAKFENCRKSRNI